MKEHIITKSNSPDFIFEPWPNGSRFVVRNHTLDGKLIAEGCATILEHIEDDRYLVQFDQDEFGEVGTFERKLRGGDMLVPCNSCGREVEAQCAGHGPGPKGEFLCPG